MWSCISHFWWSCMSPLAHRLNFTKTLFQSFFSIMGRTFERKTPKVSSADMENALMAVKSGTKVRTAARLFNVPRGTLQHRVKNERKPKHSQQVLLLHRHLRVIVVQITKRRVAVFAKNRLEKPSSNYVQNAQKSLTKHAEGKITCFCARAVTPTWT